MATFCIVMSSPPLGLPGTRTFYHLANAALAANHQVYAYCHLDGAYQLLKGQTLPDAEEGSPSGWWQTLIAKGLRVVVSEMCARSRGIESHDHLLEGARMGNPADLAEMLAKCDKVVCL